MEWFKEYKRYLKEEKKFLKRARKKKFEFDFGVLFAIVLIFLNLIVWVRFLSKKNFTKLNKKNSIIIDFLDIRGDSVIMMAKDKVILINGGFSLDILDVLKERKINKIDYIFLTYPSKRNIGGILHILYRDFPVGLILSREFKYGSIHYKRFLQLIESKNFPYRNLKKGEVINIFDDLLIQVLGPLREYEDEWENSLVLRVVYKDFAVLLSGDIKRNALDDIVEYGKELRSQILKLPSQGEVITPSFVDMVSPEIAIIVADAGGVNDEVVGFLKDWGIKVLRTDLGLSLIHI